MAEKKSPVLPLCLKRASKSFREGWFVWICRHVLVCYAWCDPNPCHADARAVAWIALIAPRALPWRCRRRAVPRPRHNKEEAIKKTAQPLRFRLPPSPSPAFLPSIPTTPAPAMEKAIDRQRVLLAHLLPSSASSSQPQLAVSTSSPAWFAFSFSPVGLPLIDRSPCRVPVAAAPPCPDVAVRRRGQRRVPEDLLLRR